MTREEALKIVRENYPHFGTTEPWLDLEKALATLIPELRENEDERIRRNLVEAFIEYKKSGGTDFHGIEIDYLLAWLEKQKEQPTDAKSERVIKAARRVLSNWLAGDLSADVSGDLTELEYAIREYDDEEEQKEQKPAEWSEEDEKTISDSCCWLAEYAGYLMDKNYGKASMLMGLTEKLKSLRPSWRPSEEQMDSLRDTIVQTKGYSYSMYLPELYEQLKKLM